MSDPYASISAAADPYADIAAEAPRAAKKPTRKRSAYGEVAGAMANVNRGLGIGDEMAAGFKTAGNLFAGKIAPEGGGSGMDNRLGVARGVVSDFKRNMGSQRQLEDEFAQDRPKVAALSRGVGMAGAVAVPGGGNANLFAEGGRAVNMVRGATTAGLQAAGYAAVDRGSVKERALGAARAARDPVTLGLGAAAGGLATPRRPKAPTPKVSDDVKLLATEGVQMTPGQMGGRLGKTAEDAGTSLPLLGDAIIDRRKEGVETFNRAVVNRALKQVGAKLPDDMQAGTSAVKHAGDLLSKGYEEAMPGRMIRADPGFADDVRSALGNVDALTPQAQQRLAQILDQRISSRLPQTGEMDGRLYKQIQSELDWEAGRFKAAQDPDMRAMGEAIEGVQGAMENAARRQDPAFAKQIDALDRGWAELGRIETAAAKSSDLSGVFTPNQYAQSVRSADGRVRRRGVARGEALSQDLAGAAVRVLPSKMPDSGTAGRAAWGMVASTPGAVVGALTGGGPGALGGIAATGATLAALSRKYSPQAIEAANIALGEKIPASDRQQALQALAEMAAKDPRVAELQRMVAAKLARAAGVSGGARAAQPANIFAQP